MYFISDLHLGHKNILKFCPDRGGSSVIEHSEWIVEQYNSVIKKRDTVWILGDVCFDSDHFKYMEQLKGQKNMLWGNHDKMSLETYQKYFRLVYGFRKKYGFWISHAPIHPQELRNTVNIHGHVHQNHILDANGQPDLRYFNVCVDACDGKPVHIDDIKQRQQDIFGGRHDPRKSPNWKS